MKRRKLIAYIILLICLILGACATLSTPEKHYLAALQTFNNNLETYIAARDAAPPATQARWKANIDPYIHQTSDALDTWHALLTDGSRESTYRTVWNKLYSLLLTSHIITIKED